MNCTRVIHPPERKETKYTTNNSVSRKREINQGSGRSDQLCDTDNARVTDEMWRYQKYEMSENMIPVTCVKRTAVNQNMYQGVRVSPRV